MPDGNLERKAVVQIGMQYEKLTTDAMVSEVSNAKNQF